MFDAYARMNLLKEAALLASMVLSVAWQLWTKRNPVEDVIVVQVTKVLVANIFGIFI